MVGQAYTGIVEKIGRLLSRCFESPIQALLNAVRIDLLTVIHLTIFGERQLATRVIREDPPSDPLSETSPEVMTLAHAVRPLYESSISAVAFYGYGRHKRICSNDKTRSLQAGDSGNEKRSKTHLCPAQLRKPS